MEPQKGGGGTKCKHSQLACQALWKAPLKPLRCGVGQARYQGHEFGGKSDLLGSKIEKVPR